MGTQFVAKILVTGAGVFIGSHLTEYLVVLLEQRTAGITIL